MHAEPLADDFPLAFREASEELLHLLLAALLQALLVGSVGPLVGGQVEVLYSAYPSLAGFVKDGRVRLLATNGAQRSTLAPDVPAIAEILPGFDFAPIVGVLARVGTPQAVIDRIATEVVAVTRMPDAIQQMKTAGIDPVGAGPAEYGKAIADENARMASAIQAAGLKRSE